MPLGNNRSVRAMKSRTYGALLASLCAIALVLAANETFAATRSTSAHLVSHRLAGHLLRPHRRPQTAIVWPGDDGSFYGPNGESMFDGPPPSAPGGARFTNTNDIPWDWAHRYPPAVVPTERPYVSSCSAETVTVPDGRGGKEEINIVRCY
jgi:hypothetical protein